MARVPLITERSGLTPEQGETFDRIVSSRGAMIRPFQVLMHAPEIAGRVAELGHVIRFQSGLAAPDRELAIIAAGRALGCTFVWESHDSAAREAGVRSEALDILEGGEGVLTPREQTLVDFVTGLCTTASVTDEVFDRVRDLLGTTGVVELAATVGYYTMLGFTMSACEAC